MLVHWKRLCSLGVLFWFGMSTYDYYCGSILVPGEFGKSDPNELLDVKAPPQSFQFDKEHEPSGWSFWTYVITFLSVSMLSVLVYVSWKFYPKRIVNSNEMVATNNAIRAALFDGSFDSLSPTTDNILIIHDSKYDVCPTNRFKAKEENIELVTATKEVATLNKKLDGLNDEKRNLTRFLAQSEKDNRIIKQKMMEVLRDKNVLLKRLEAATREIRSSTVARQATLDKLEESIQCSNQFKQQIQQMSTEKSEHLRRLRQLENQLKSLKRQQDNKSSSCRSSSNGVKQPSKVPCIDSTKDIEQIEMKLHDLEASLEKMKCKNSDKSDEFESEDNDDTSDSEPKILRQVSSSDMNFLSEVEPSYTNLLAKFDCEPRGSNQLHHQIVESIAPAVGPCYDKRRKFAVTNMFGSALFNILNLIQQQDAECNSGLARQRNPVVVNYAVVCNYKCPYTERIAMLGSNYFGRRSKEMGEDEKKKTGKFGCQEMVKYEPLPANIL